MYEIPPHRVQPAGGMADRLGVDVSDRTCKIEGCEQPLACRGWCQMHYVRWKTHGDPGSAARVYVRPRATDEDRLRHTGWTPVVRVPELGECWEWNGGINPKSGYGILRTGARTEPPHRVAYRVFIGDLDSSEFVLHRCDNRRCVRPDHLRVGTNQANMDDMNAKGRGRFVHGEIHGNAKLSDTDVSTIRASIAGGATRRAVATRFGISAGHVSRIVSGKARTRPAGYDSAALR